MFFRKRQDQGIEGRLRTLSAEPRDEFVRELSGHVRESRLRTTVRSRRFVAALVTSGLMLIPFVAFGGVSYAAGAAKQAVQSVSNTGNSNKGNNNSGDNNKGNQNSGDDNKGNQNSGDDNKGNNNKPDKDEYENGKKCGHDAEDRGQLKPNQKPCPPQAGKKDH